MALRWIGGIFAVILGWVMPLPVSASPSYFCEGKYEKAARLVDAAMGKYGTLYSGGNFRFDVDDIRGTLALYRFWKGYPDLELDRLKNIWWEMRYFSFRQIQRLQPEQVWRRARWGLKKTIGPDKTRMKRAWSVLIFDLLTSVGPAPDWWHRPQDFNYLTQWQRWVAEKARTEPFLDWLQTVLAGSAAPWARYPHLFDPKVEDPADLDAHDRLAASALSRYEAGEGIEWLAAAAVNIHESSGRRVQPVKQRIDRYLQDIGRDIKRCWASPRDYAVLFSVLPALKSGPFLQEAFSDPVLSWAIPKSILHVLGVARLDGLVVDSLKTGKPIDEQKLKPLFHFGANEAQRRGMKLNMDLARLYTAQSVDQLPLLDHPFARRVYNFLSADDIARLASRDDDLGAPLLRAAFARYIALGNWRRAEALLPRLRAVLPKEAERIDRLWRTAHARNVRLALIALHTPNTSPDIRLFRHLHVDLTELQGDLELWLQLPRMWHSMRMRKGWAGRQIGRHRYIPREVLPSLQTSDGSGQIAGFRRLIAHDEIRALTQDMPFMHRLAAVIIPWADARTDSWRERKFWNHDLEAESLARLIRLCRYNSCGDMHGMPAQQYAFKLLHSRMGDTEAARKTRYWWRSSPRH